MKRALILAGLGLVAVVLTAVVVGAVFGGSKPEQADPIVSESPEPAISATKAQYTDALTQAKDWQQNATLARVYRNFKGSLDPSRPTPLVFSFASLAEPKQVFEVEFAGTDVSSRKADKQSFELAFNPIDVAAWKVDPDNALKIAEENGGQGFREEHLAGYTLLQQLAKVGAHPLQWYFRYDTGDGSRKRLEIWVNAETGGIDFQKETTR